MLVVAAIALAIGLRPLTVLYQIAAIAIPEELFFRGYVQTRAEHRCGAGKIPILISALLFAAAHVAIQPGWMRAAVFFPGLVMGWLRHRTRGLAVPAAFHAAANLAVHALGPLAALR